MWDLEFIDLILFLSEKYVTAEIYQAIAKDTWGGLKNGKLNSAFSEVYQLCFVCWMAVMAIQPWTSTHPFVMYMPSAHTKSGTPPSLILQSRFSYYPCFVPSFFSERRCENTDTYKFFPNWVTMFLLVFSHLSWFHTFVRRIYFLLALRRQLFFPFFFLLMATFLYASSLSIRTDFGLLGFHFALSLWVHIAGHCCSCFKIWLV